MSGDLNLYTEFPKSLQKPMEDLVDAFLYLGPQELTLREQMPADIALGFDYMTELQRRASLAGFPGAVAGARKEFDQQVVKSAANPLFGLPTASESKQKCLHLKGRSSTSQ
jgi:hypothetical protein